MILLLKCNNKTNICFFNGGFTFIVFFLWFWFFCGFCTLISVGVIWFVIWWAFGFLLRFDFGWVLAVVVVVIWFWLSFGSGAWLEVMSLKSSDHGGLEGELMCNLVGFFTFNVFILWFWLFCGFCALISVGVIWFVIWKAFGISFCELILTGFWQWCVVGVDKLEKLRPWRFRRRVWWSTMEHNVTWVEAERGWKGTKTALDILGPKTRTKNWAFFILIY